MGYVDTETFKNVIRRIVNKWEDKGYKMEIIHYRERGSPDKVLINCPNMDRILEAYIDRDQFYIEWKEKIKTVRNYQTIERWFDKAVIEHLMEK